MGIVIRAVFLFGLVGVIAPISFFLVLSLVKRLMGFSLAEDSAVLQNKSPFLKSTILRWLSSQ